MNLKIKSMLLPFYFGSITDSERTLVERELLTDSETLLDYLDLKRSIEIAEEMPKAPSLAVWQSLRMKVVTRKKIIWSISIGAAAVLVLAFSIYMMKSDIKDNQRPVSPSPEILFDSLSEPTSNQNVL